MNSITIEQQERANEATKKQFADIKDLNVYMEFDEVNIKSYYELEINQYNDVENYFLSKLNDQ